MFCPDSELLQRKIKQLEKNPSAERICFWGDEDNFEKFWQNISMASLFSVPKTIVVRNAQSAKNDFWLHMDTAYKAISRDVSVFFCIESEWKNKKPIPAVIAKKKVWQDAEKENNFWAYEGLEGKDKEQFIVKICEERDIKMQKSVFTLLVHVLPKNARSIRMELEKLALFTSGREVEKDDLACIHVDKEKDFFQIVEMIATGSSPLELWKEILSNHMGASKDAITFPVLRSMAREARVLWQIYVNDPNLRLPNFIRQKKQKYSLALGKTGLRKMFSIAFDAEFSIKTGLRNPEQALDFIVAELFILLNKQI